MSSSSLRGSFRPFPILRLALADLLDEWLLSLCVALAIAAVLAPLLILFGLKNGAVDILRQRLIQDPRNREIRPKITKAYEKAWFDEIRKRPDIAFVIPLTRGIASTVQVKKVGGGVQAAIDISPTGKGDAMVEENGAKAPGEGECVLSATAAEKLGAGTGDRVEVCVERFVGLTRQGEKKEMKVVGVLDLRAGAREVAYVPLGFVEAVEQFIDGQAVPEYGWEGSKALARPEFDGALLFCPPGEEPFSKAYQRKAVTDTGFVRVEKITPEDLLAKEGLRVKGGWEVWLLRPAGTSVLRQENFELLSEKLRGSEIEVLPWVADIPVSLSPDTRQQYPAKVRVFPPATEKWKAVGVEPVVSVDAKGEGAKFWAVFPEGVPAKDSKPWRLSLGAQAGINIPVSPVEGKLAPSGEVLVSSELAGLLRQSLSRKVSYDEKTGEFLLSRRGDSGFRIFAKTIEDVDGVRQYLEKQEISVFHEAERINDVQVLDAQLSSFFWFIAVIGLAGAVATLATSLYASVERKKYELAVLRLLGLRRFEIVFFPAWQAVFLTLGGAVIAGASYFCADAVLVSQFGSMVKEGEKLTLLPFDVCAVGLVLLVLLAIASSLLASMRIFGTCLSDALREGSA